MDSVAAGRWGTWGTGGTVGGGGGGGGNASASSLTSFGRDEKILTAAAAGLGASVLAALGLWIGVSHGCEPSNSSAHGSVTTFTEKLKQIFATPTNSNDGSHVKLTFEYYYEDIAAGDTANRIVVPEAYIPQDKANDAEKYIQGKVNSNFKLYKITQVSVVSDQVPQVKGYKVTLYFNSEDDADALWDELVFQ